MTTSNPIIAVTGATGFVGAHVVRDALARGYRVRSVVRSEKKGDELLRSMPGPSHSLAFVSDIRNKDELKQAFKNVKIVQHVASPYTMAFDDPVSEMLEPAIKGTMSVLEAANEENVEHVLITSSFAAINCFEKGGSIRDYTYTEADWNPATYDIARTSSKAYTYCASKALAEKAAWEYVREAQPSFALTTFNPPGIVGPIAHPLERLEDLNTSCANVWHLVSGSCDEVPPTFLPQTVDVRDVSKALVDAMSNPATRGERFALCGYYVDMQVVVDYLRKTFPERRDAIPAGNPGTRNQPGPIARLDASKAERVLGITWTPWEKTYGDLVKQLLELEEKFKAERSKMPAL
ncbi:hypothetical protein MGL_4160 [Malassezia globosa CBS 7966]|uniref:3-beta hydroxysteroid dehydrogenase/isomerase domain-containing protein n=1 Tax=Malassezia globosa (strain ATCC MYA-4612 / CBS 7966) TaxID=425265 RepID=A8QD80_MALGO|nr:uncharacterized protein MGL_4148 [Malassezia globosa CBS 7966]XP_001728675.1 uncharacterized protein MGL_4154 [Malassezia globosa CBS 7966]XP_001728681.1 uncharacterized protein MGL_4160 [Malassezia globosa CBS 7966]EDP41455.1 hypothetical protein MGL_4148 [Malassezia globosa CBS 7966]EDP41461.1 hypothetical protein MGL_4154 [Malassezia globosa CBS 7966]EDP41467.1 hypothetical protein MGL_4160 [Malassezia globosa CBS 7966]